MVRSHPTTEVVGFPTHTIVKVVRSHRKPNVRRYENHEFYEFPT